MSKKRCISLLVLLGLGSILVDIPSLILSNYFQDQGISNTDDSFIQGYSLQSYEDYGALFDC